MGKASRNKKERKDPNYVTPVKKQNTQYIRRSLTTNCRNQAHVVERHKTKLIPGSIGFCSKQIATELTTPTNVISIRFENDSWPTFAVGHNRLLSVVLPLLERGESIDPEVCEQIYQFARECHEETIVVHCGEGRIRSPAVATAIAATFGLDVRSHEMLGHTLSSGAMDIRIHNQLSDYLEMRFVDDLAKASSNPVL